MYDFDAMRNALLNLGGYVQNSVRGDAAYTRVLAEVAELTAEATEDAEAVNSMSVELFLAGMNAADAQCTIDAQAKKIAELEAKNKELVEALTQSLLSNIVGSMVIDLQQDLLNAQDTW